LVCSLKTDCSAETSWGRQSRRSQREIDAMKGVEDFRDEQNGCKIEICLSSIDYAGMYILPFHTQERIHVVISSFLSLCFRISLNFPTYYARSKMAALLPISQRHTPPCYYPARRPHILAGVEVGLKEAKHLHCYAPILSTVHAFGWRIHTRISPDSSRKIW
jgi:hypothetical protein